LLDIYRKTKTTEERLNDNRVEAKEANRRGIENIESKEDCEVWQEEERAIDPVNLSALPTRKFGGDRRTRNAYGAHPKLIFIVSGLHSISTTFPIFWYHPTEWQRQAGVPAKTAVVP
jgi:hypothetical protein